jgi:hypothetical protein
MTLDGMGTTNGSLALDQDASLGYYNIQVIVPDAMPTKEREGTSFGVSFQVAEYRKPEYEVSAQTDRPEYIQGEQIQTTVQANYFFGQPVKGAKVRWVLLTSDQLQSARAARRRTTASPTGTGMRLEQPSGVEPGASQTRTGAFNACRHPRVRPAPPSISRSWTPTAKQSRRRRAQSYIKPSSTSPAPQSYVATGASRHRCTDDDPQESGERNRGALSQPLRWYSVKEQARTATLLGE